MKDNKLYLIHIQDCLSRINDYTKNGRDDFMENRLLQDAVLRNLEVMGESTKKLPEGWKLSEPDVKWGKIAGFRNVLAHDYLEVDLDVVWDIIENYLPDLQRAIASISDQFWHD